MSWEVFGIYSKSDEKPVVGFEQRNEDLMSTFRSSFAEWRINVGGGQERKQRERCKATSVDFQVFV